MVLFYEARIALLAMRASAYYRGQPPRLDTIAEIICLDTIQFHVENLESGQVDFVGRMLNCIAIYILNSCTQF